ncbi:hypothetical protein E3P99_01628 [Wallemia hederae]|uniref:Uncharacterized protein n=1 Tax=Wallemia hederae TaxID=1540922 RepID=A0A4T0FNS7_9BASI|nr:hypothetical protein E3P99_01628 [Wallemia hederae]
MEIDRAQPPCRTKSVHRAHGQSSQEVKPTNASATTTTLEDVALAMNISIPEKGRTSTATTQELYGMSEDMLRERIVRDDSAKLHLESELGLSTAIAYQLFQENEKLKAEQSRLLAEIDDFSSMISNHLNVDNADFVIQKRQLSVVLRREVENTDFVDWIESQANELRGEVTSLTAQLSRQKNQSMKEIRELRSERDLLKSSIASIEERFADMESQVSLSRRKPLPALRQEWRQSKAEPEALTTGFRFPQVVNDSPLAMRRHDNAAALTTPSSSPQLRPFLHSTTIPVTNIPHRIAESSGTPTSSIVNTPLDSPALHSVKHTRSFSDSAFMLGANQQKKLSLERELAIARSLNERTKVVFQSVEQFTTYVFNIPSSLSLTQAIIAINLTIAFVVLSATLRTVAKVLLYMYLTSFLLLFLLRSQVKTLRALSQ